MPKAMPTKSRCKGGHIQRLSGHRCSAGSSNGCCRKLGSQGPSSRKRSKVYGSPRSRELCRSAYSSEKRAGKMTNLGYLNLARLESSWRKMTDHSLSSAGLSLMGQISDSLYYLRSLQKTCGCLRRMTMCHLILALVDQFSGSSRKH